MEKRDEDFYLSFILEWGGEVNWHSEITQKVLVWRLESSSLTSGIAINPLYGKITYQLPKHTLQQTISHGELRNNLQDFSFLDCKMGVKRAISELCTWQAVRTHYIYLPESISVNKGQKTQKRLKQEEWSYWLLGGRNPGSDRASSLSESRGDMTSLNLSFHALVFEVGFILHVHLTCHLVLPRSYPKWFSSPAILPAFSAQPSSQHSQQMVYCFWLAQLGLYAHVCCQSLQGNWRCVKKCSDWLRLESHAWSLALGVEPTSWNRLERSL